MPASIQELLDSLPQTGVLEWIGTRPGRKEPMLTPTSVIATTSGGITGDRFKARSTTRQITLIQAEHLSVIGSCLGTDPVDPGLLRRNLVIQGINLLALKDRLFSVGSVQLKGTGLCHPCSRMEQLLGPGGYNAVRGHGGITAQVVSEGTMTVGDTVAVS